MVYTSTSKALATLELLVHFDQSVAPTDLVEVSITIPEGLNIDRVDDLSLPRDWRKPDHPHLQAIGAAWVTSMSSVALQVPSAVIGGEWNILLNPAHPEFAKLIPGKPNPFPLDNRLFHGKGGFNPAPTERTADQ